MITPNTTRLYFSYHTANRITVNKNKREIQKSGREMIWMNCCKDVLLFFALIAVLCTDVGVNILFKAATEQGLSFYVFIVYSYAVSALFLLLPLPFIFHRSTGLPPFTVSLLCRIFLLALIGFLAQFCGYRGIEYSSPTLASAIANLQPAYIFILAVIFRMEKAVLTSPSTQAKILGSIVSISGALVAVLYKGPIILSSLSPTHSPSRNFPLDSSQRNWILGGFLLAAAYVLMSIWFIVMTHIMELYPSVFIVVFLTNLCGVIISAPVCYLLEANLHSWTLESSLAIVAIIYSGFLSTGANTFVNTWGIHLKGPVYVSSFKPLSVVIAAVMSFIFLGDTLDLGCAIGALILSCGFYAVLWGKSKEEELTKDENCGLGHQSDCKTPLLQDTT